MEKWVRVWPEELVAEWIEEWLRLWHESHVEAIFDRGGWLSVLSEQMEQRGSAEAVAVLERERGGWRACCGARWSTRPRIGSCGR